MEQPDLFAPSALEQCRQLVAAERRAAQTDRDDLRTDVLLGLLDLPVTDPWALKQEVERAFGQFGDRVPGRLQLLSALEKSLPAHFRKRVRIRRELNDLFDQRKQWHHEGAPVWPDPNWPHCLRHGTAEDGGDEPRPSA
jgi:hypothetical protein